MLEVTGSKSWRREEFTSLVEDTGIRYTGDAIGISTPAFEAKRSKLVFEESAESESVMTENGRRRNVEGKELIGALIPTQ